MRRGLLRKIKEQQQQHHAVAVNNRPRNHAPHLPALLHQYAWLFHHKKRGHLVHPMPTTITQSRVVRFILFQCIPMKLFCLSNNPSNRNH
ncbi:hypothetical protein DPMN_091622 [Dreissena polymorpha]|uniref:Uncharacterized protein n=1 Tax=Dreissena polymorpha TaxID=45954 RepID=A0A9D4QZA2_DREPO|nr:hypothetical protein DPMN_091622 [Dreissena polymorpha]